MDNEQAASPASAETPSSNVESTQQRYDSMGDDGSFFAASLPAEVVRRVNALRNLQVEHHKIEASFFEEVHALECRYLSKYQPLYEKRLNIVKGVYEPTDAEAKCAFDEDETDEQAKKAAEEEKKDEQKKEEEKAVGIPEFWLQVLRNSDVVSDLIREHDEEVLKHLIDVRISMQNEGQQKGFTIEFEFTPNEYFTNTILTKSYELRTGPDEHEPLSYEGPEIVKSKGCEIQWNKGKNVTVKMVKKRQKHKNRGTIRVVTKEVQTDSFFNFFSPPAVPEDPEAEVEDSEEMRMLAADFEIGHMLRDSIVPKAVLYYTGEVGDEEGDFDEDEEDEDDEEDDDDDDDQDDDENEGHGGGRGGHHHHHGAGGKHGGKSRGGKHGGAGAGGQQPECKQQ
jgi:nucleosome assembly protein 1-like 1